VFYLLKPTKFFPRTKPHFRMGWLQALIVPMCLAVALSLASAATQEPVGDPDQTPERPAPANFQNPFPPADLAFLNDYAGRMGKELRKDKRFRALMKQMVPRTTYHYGRDMPLSEAIEAALDSQTLPVDVREGRYVTVGSNGGSYLLGRGFLWFDMQSGIALGGFFFRPTNGEPTPTLTIFSRQLNQTELVSSQLPLAFLQDESQWAAIAGVPQISPRYFIPGNGKKYALIHDEDFCRGTSQRPDAACEQMNADAADADMNAAYFMAQTHNQANATAWMLDGEQIAWIGLRDRTCFGPNSLGCRIRITRLRTRVFIRGVARR
jgi:hypothetical protein